MQGIYSYIPGKKILLEYIMLQQFCDNNLYHMQCYFPTHRFRTPPLALSKVCLHAQYGCFL
jgi:hypothetical protein